MNTLTKVCIVVLVVLILVSMPVFITLANIVPNWHKAFVQEQQQKLIAESNHRVAMASTNTLLANYERNKAVNAAKITAIEAAVQQRDEQIKAANLADVQLRADLGSAQDATKRQQTLAASQLDVNKELIGQIDKQRTQINEKDTEIISLRKAKDDAEANSVRDKAAARLALEQLVAADMKNRELTDKLEKALSGQRVSNAGPSDILKADKGPIIGTVTTVTGNLASINVGKVKGIEKGMVLVIYRSDEYIGRLQIESVELDNAAGVIVDKKHEPKANDKVVTKIPLN